MYVKIALQAVNLKVCIPKVNAVLTLVSQVTCESALEIVNMDTEVGEVIDTKCCCYLH